ncbi:MAG TPA: SMP-30/gluconolactonase/LRE family protein, partial [Spirochaetia bacterium]|nr:SMP-30/gluconolactonase/LRE family protein [Spirochaetia bacterium]
GPAKAAITFESEWGTPDGMTIDAGGNLWIAHWNTHLISHWNPKTGNVLSKVQIPSFRVTSCMFGGPDLRTLYVTTGTCDATEADLQDFPLSGALLGLEPAVGGIPESRLLMAANGRG